MAGSASAATIDVTATEDRVADNGDCTLREAVISANEDRAVDACAKGAYEDTIALKGETYGLSIRGPLENLAATGDLDLTDPVRLVGVEGVTRIVAPPADRVLHVMGTTATVDGLTITGGDVSDQATTEFYEEGRGGGVLLQSTVPANSAMLELEDSTITGNRAALGGGISTALDRSMDPYLLGGYDPSDSAVYISRSTISRNRSTGQGGGIYVMVGSGAILSSTVSGNVAGSRGGGISTSLARFEILGSTIADNRAAEGGGFDSFGHSAEAKGSIIGGSIVSGNEAAVGPDCSGSINSAGANVVAASSGCELKPRPYAADDLLDVDPRLGPLAQNGGPTETHAIDSDSPANNLYIQGEEPPDGTYPFYCQPTDQRGEARSADGSRRPCDAGAFEVVECRGLPATVTGTTGDDRIIGTPGDDVMQAAFGDDEIRGRGGNDIICSGAGEDLVTGGPGRDHIEAGGGGDIVRAGSGKDFVRGSRSGDSDFWDDADRLYGDSGDDRLFGGYDADLISGGRGRDRVDGGTHDDVCDGGPDRDRLRSCEQRSLTVHRR